MARLHRTPIGDLMARLDPEREDAIRPVKDVHSLFERVGAHRPPRLLQQLDLRFDGSVEQRRRRRAHALETPTHPQRRADLDRILTFGIEAAGHLSQTFALRVRRIGREALSISASGAGLADTLLTLRSGDALVAIADEQSPTEMTVVLAEAQASRVPVVLLTDALSARSIDHFSVALVSSRGEAGGFKTLTTTAVLLDTLLLGLAARDRARSLLTLERFDRLRSQLTRRRSRSTET
jgi:D-arabinose 5-phosphate isomerase GutQ